MHVEWSQFTMQGHFSRKRHYANGGGLYLVLGAHGLDRPRPLLQLKKKDPKVGAPEIECEILSTLSACREVVHVSDEALDVGGSIGCLEQTSVDLVKHSLLDVQ